MSELELDQEQVHGDTTQTEQMAKIDSMMADDYDPDAEKPEVKKKPKQELAEPDIDAAEFVGDLIGVGFSLVAARKGEHWNITEKESLLIGTKAARVLDKYMPSFESGPEAALLFSLLVIVGPRVAIDKKLSQLPPIEGETDSDKPEESGGLQP